MSADPKIEGALEALKPGWLAQAERDLAQVDKLLESMTRAGAALPMQSKQLHGIVHNLKGQAGTFGFALLSQIAATLCQIIREHAGELVPAYLPILRAHHAALKFVLLRRLEGDGGDAGLAILAKLTAIQSK